VFEIRWLFQRKSLLNAPFFIGQTVNRRFWGLFRLNSSSNALTHSDLPSSLWLFRQYSLPSFGCDNFSVVEHKVGAVLAWHPYWILIQLVGGCSDCLEQLWNTLMFPSLGFFTSTSPVLKSMSWSLMVVPTSSRSCRTL
jgi:hypothetical protein